MSSVLKGSLACVVCSAEALPTPSVRDTATARAMRFNFYLPVQGFPAATGKGACIDLFLCWRAGCKSTIMRDRLALFPIAR